MPHALLGLSLTFLFLEHDPAFVQSSEFFPPFTAQPHCIAANLKTYLIVVMHCVSCSHCISNRFCCCGKPSIGLTLEQHPHLSPCALQLCTTSSTAQCDHAHAMHTALRKFAESRGKFVGKIAGYFSTATAKRAESRKDWRKVAESRGKSQQFAKIRGKSRKVAEIHGKSRRLAERRRTTTCSSALETTS